MDDESENKDLPVFRIDEVIKLLNDLAEITDTLHRELSDLKEEIKEIKTILDEINVKNNEDSSSRKNFMHG